MSFSRLSKGLSSYREEQAVEALEVLDPELEVLLETVAVEGNMEHMEVELEILVQRIQEVIVELIGSNLILLQGLFQVIWRQPEGPSLIPGQMSDQMIDQEVIPEKHREANYQPITNHLIWEITLWGIQEPEFHQELQEQVRPGKVQVLAQTDFKSKVSVPALVSTVKTTYLQIKELLEYLI